MESWLFLALVLLIAIFGHNSSLIIATVVVMVLKLIPFPLRGAAHFEQAGGILRNPHRGGSAVVAEKPVQF